MLFLILFSFFIILTGASASNAIQGDGAWSIIMFLGCLLATIIFAICFAWAWEDIFESDTRDE